MPEPTKLPIPVPSQDPKKKKPEDKPDEDVKDAAAKKKDEEKEGEELVRMGNDFSGMQLTSEWL